MIKIANLVKYYAQQPVFNAYSITLSAPKICLEAPNGAGKTTLLSIIAGLEGYQAGRLTYGDKVLANPVNAVALASDKVAFPEFLTAKQIIDLVAKSWRCTVPEPLVTGFNFTEQLAVNYRALSTGNKKKCQLICALMRQPHYLLLDEPSASLDEASVQFLLLWLQRFTGQVVITCHEPAPFVAQGFVCQPL